MKTYNTANMVEFLNRVDSWIKYKMAVVELYENVKPADEELYRFLWDYLNSVKRARKDTFKKDHEEDESLRSTYYFFYRQRYLIAEAEIYHKEAIELGKIELPF